MTQGAPATSLYQASVEDARRNESPAPSQISNYATVANGVFKVKTCQRIFSDRPHSEISLRRRISQMGKKRTHAETKDGFAKPPPGQDRVKKDKKDARKGGDGGKKRSALVCYLHDALEMVC